MIAYIKGILEEVEENAVILDCGGVGYRVQVPLTVIDEMPSSGSAVKLHTYFSVKEDSMSLYGFLTKTELWMFRLLIGVNGIGPKGGLAILSTLQADELRFAILTDNAKAIAKAPGVGVKTAQRIVMELKDKMGADILAAPEADIPLKEKGKQAGNSVAQEAAEALSALGYSSAEAWRAVKQVEITETITVEEVLKQALKHMSFL